MEELYLYGSGQRCEILLELLKNTNIKVRGILDSNPDKWGVRKNGMVIKSPSILDEEKNVPVCVTFYSPLVEEPLWIELRERYGIHPDYILSFHDVIWYIYKKYIPDSVGIKKHSRKILFDGSWGLGLGGVESWLKDVTSGLVEAGVENIYLVTKQNERNAPQNMQNHLITLYSEYENNFCKEEVLKGIEVLADNLPCSAVFSRVDELLIAASLIKQCNPEAISIIMVDHGSCDGMYRDILSYQHSIDQYVCVSQGIGKELINRGVQETRVVSMTAPVNSEKVLNRRYTIDPDRPINIGYAGRIEVFEKRVDILLKVIEEMERIGVNYQMYIAGTGSYLTTVEKFIADKSLEARVKVVGMLPRSKMAKFWQRMDLALNTSDNEGRPLSNLEAMVNGAVPVVTETIGILDDVRNEKNGFIVPINDYKSMAEKIEYLDEHRELIVQYGTEARREILEKANMEKHICFWKKLLFERTNDLEADIL